MKYLKLFETFIKRTEIKTIVGLDSKQYKEAVTLCATELFRELEGEVEYDYIYDDINENGNPNLSVACFLQSTNEMIGSLIISDRNLEQSLQTYSNENPNIEWFLDDSVFDNKKGVEGLSLAVKDIYRGGFVVYEILNKINNLDYDYVIIQQYESLKSNINYLNKGCKKLCRIITEEQPEPIIYYVYFIKPLN